MRSRRWVIYRESASASFRSSEESDWATPASGSVSVLDEKDLEERENGSEKEWVAGKWRCSGGGCGGERKGGLERK